MMKLQVILIISIIGVEGFNGKKPWQFQGTTPGIKDIVLGRCYTYLELSLANRNNGLTINVDCNKLWETFRNCWAGKDPCSVTEDSYRSLFVLLNTKRTVKNKVNKCYLL